jgi:hypothetical protein
MESFDRYHGSRANGSMTDEVAHASTGSDMATLMEDTLFKAWESRVEMDDINLRDPKVMRSLYGIYIVQDMMGEKVSTLTNTAHIRTDLLKALVRPSNQSILLHRIASSCDQSRVIKRRIICF